MPRYHRLRSLRASPPRETGQLHRPCRLSEPRTSTFSPLMRWPDQAHRTRAPSVTVFEARRQRPNGTCGVAAGRGIVSGRPGARVTGIRWRPAPPTTHAPENETGSASPNATSVRGLDRVFGVPMLHGFAWWRNTILSACIGVSEDRFRLDRRIVASCFPLLTQERIRSTQHALSERFDTHSPPLPDFGRERCVQATERRVGVLGRLAAGSLPHPGGGTSPRRSLHSWSHRHSPASEDYDPRERVRPSRARLVVSAETMRAHRFGE
jgi:hypothetical protein